MGRPYDVRRTCSNDSGVPCFFSRAHARIHTPFLDLKWPSAWAKIARAVSTPPLLREFSASSIQVLSCVHSAA